MVVLCVAVQMSNFHPFRTRTEKGNRYQAVNRGAWLSVAQHDTEMVTTRCGGGCGAQYAPTHKPFTPVHVDNTTIKTANPAKCGCLIPTLISGDVSPDFLHQSRQLAAPPVRSPKSSSALWPPDRRSPSSILMTLLRPALTPMLPLELYGNMLTVAQPHTPE